MSYVHSAPNLRTKPGHVSVTYSPRRFPPQL